MLLCTEANVALVRECDLIICLQHWVPRLTPEKMSSVQRCARNSIWMPSCIQKSSPSALLFHLEEFISSRKYAQSYFCFQKHASLLKRLGRISDLIVLLH